MRADLSADADDSARSIGGCQGCTILDPKGVVSIHLNEIWRRVRRWEHTCVILSAIGCRKGTTANPARRTPDDQGVQRRVETRKGGESWKFVPEDAGVQISSNRIPEDTSRRIGSQKERQPGRKIMKKLKKRIGGLFFVLLTFCVPLSTMAMVDPWGVPWRDNNRITFTNAVYNAVLGRAATASEVDRALRVRSKIQIFWEAVAKPEYKSMFGNLTIKYRVYEKSLSYTDANGSLRFCRCFYVAEKDNHTLLAGPYNFPIARAVAIMNNAFTLDSCQFADCGFSRLGLNPNDPVTPARGNIVIDPNFASFGSPSGPWGRNVQYGRNGIWWNSNGARSTATMHISREGKTALHITNASRIGPHVFGTTAQRIRTEVGQRYQVSIMAAGRHMSSNSSLYIVVDPKWLVRPVSMSKGTYGWTRFAGEFTAQGDYADLRIISADSCGEVLIREVTVKAIR